MSEPEPHKPGRRLDKHFRWRGTEVSRVEAIADAVFGLVLAMLLLNEHPPESFAGLTAAIKSLIPFAVTFTCIAMIWFEHYLLFRRYDLHDGPSIALTFLLLFLVLGFAYPLKLMFTVLTVRMFGPIGQVTDESLGQFRAETFVVYSLAYAAIYATIALMYRCAQRRRRELELDACEVFLTRSAIVSCLVHVGVGLLSVTLLYVGITVESASFIVTSGMPGWIYFILGPAMGMHGAWEGRNLRRLTTG